MIKKVNDYGYRKLFSNKTIFKQLMETFVKEKWVDHIDYSKFEPLNKSYISENYKNTEGDLIVKTQLKDKDFYIYVLIEFQSSVDKFMALRILNYITNFYMDLIDSNSKLKSLPLIFPLMIYNGDKKWSYSEKISDLIPNSDLLGEYKLNFKYFKILENELNTETLLSIKNIVSTLFLSEIDYDSETLIEEMINLFDNEKDKQAVSLFLNWFRILSENGKIKEDDYKEMETLYKDKGEISSMLVTALKKEKKRLREEAIAEGKAEGRAEGRAEGKAKGRSEGKAEILVKILNKKFANVSDSIIVKINSIDDESKLDELIDRVFEINLIDELNL